MYELTVSDTFSAAHRLKGYKGKCERLHGHNWKVEMTVRSRRLGRSGMAVDFKDLRGMLARVLSELDHADLNDVDAFACVNPSSENIARLVFSRLDEMLMDGNAALARVTVWESENCSASYYR